MPDPDNTGPLLAPQTSTTYDVLGGMQSQTDRLGHGTTDTYDGLHRLSSQTDSLSGVTAFTYDDDGERLTLTDPVSNTTTWVYDNLGRVTSETNQLSAARTFTYNAGSELTSKTDRDDRVTQYGYDHLLRPTTETWLDATSTPIFVISTAYDLAGQVTSAGDSNASFTYLYDNLGRVTNTHQTYASLTGAIDFTQAYDADGMRTLLAADIASTHDFSNNYVYDNLHRLTKLTQAGVTGGNAVAEKRVDFGYNAAGQSTSIDRYSNVAGSSLVASSAYSYDLAARLTGLAHTDSSSTPIAGYGWTFDAANRITGVNFTDPAHASESAAYSYDDTNQLTSSVRSGGTDSDTYDANGNRINTGFTTSADNRLTSDGTYTYLYDAEGNRTAKFVDANSNGVADTGDTDISTYTWDYRDRLTEVSHVSTFGGTPDVDVQYTYDMFNRLIDRVVASATPEQQHFAYEGIEAILTFDGASATDITTRAIWGPAVDQIMGTEDVTSLSTAGTRSWALTDQQNSVRDWAIDSGSILVHQNFDSFGKLVSTPPTSTFFVGYTGKCFDILVGLQDNLNRWYDNSTHGWISHDPIESDRNSYRYVSNNPDANVDSDGLKEHQGWISYWSQYESANSAAFQSPGGTARRNWALSELARGCVGVVSSAIGATYNGYPDMRVAYRTLQEAMAFAKGCGCPAASRAVIFSIHFWRDPLLDPNYKTEPADRAYGTRVDPAWIVSHLQRGRPADKKAGHPDDGFNFDFGLLLSDGVHLRHADHCFNPVDPNTGRGKYFPQDPVEKTEPNIFTSSLQEWQAGAPVQYQYWDFNSEVWCVACTSNTWHSHTGPWR